MGGGVEFPGHPVIGKDIGEVIGVPPKGISVMDTVEAMADNVDVITAFTAPPDPTVVAAEIAGRAGVPMVIGTTGLSPDQVETMTHALKNVACVFAPNFSVGVTVLVQLVEEAAHILGGDYDAEIVEAHHRFKTDAPSGTGLCTGRSRSKGIESQFARGGRIWSLRRYGRTDTRRNRRTRHSRWRYRRRTHGHVRRHWRNHRTRPSRSKPRYIRLWRDSGPSPLPLEPIRGCMTCAMYWGCGKKQM